MSPRSVALLLATVACALSPSASAASALKFSLGSTATEIPSGYTHVPRDTLFSRERGYGFEPRTPRDGDSSFHFTTRVPVEGNYRVSVLIGHRHAATNTTVRAELRRLMAENVRTKPNEFKLVTFTVNTRTPVIAARGDIAAGKVRLKAPRETIQEAWAWDDALTLEFAGENPAVSSIEIEPVDVPTVFLLGDSTVCDQSKEPYNSWGQMLTRWFKPTVAIANHGESGETYRDSLGRRRIDKIASLLKPGDWVIMQFGHNDQKQIAAGTGGPFTTYQAELKKHLELVRAYGGTPIVVSPMERRLYDRSERTQPSLSDYAEAARQTAEELGVAFLDLHAMSKVLYAALGHERSARAFAAPNGKLDNTHHNNYGSYQLAKCIVQAIRDQKLPLAEFIVADFPDFDPAQPDDPDSFAIPPSANFTNERPLGD